MEGILASGFAQGGFAFILGIVILSILRGWLVPKPQVDRMEISYLAQIDNWKATVAASAAQTQLLLEQQQRLMEIVYSAAHASAVRREEAAGEVAT